jgi:hypothetical protein
MMKLAPKNPEIVPQRPMEKPTEPNRHIPEQNPQKLQESPNFPTPTIPERRIQRPRIKPTKLNP